MLQNWESLKKQTDIIFGMFHLYSSISLYNHGKALVGKHVLYAIVTALSVLLPKSKREEKMVNYGLKVIQQAWNLHLENQELVTIAISKVLEKSRKF